MCLRLRPTPWPPQRLHVFLFELALVLTRPPTREDREGGHLYQVYRQPFPNALLNLEDIPDTEAGGGGTFRTAFTGGNDKGQSFYIQLNTNCGIIAMVSMTYWCISCSVSC